MPLQSDSQQALPKGVVQTNIGSDDGFTMSGWIFLIMFGWALYTVVKKFLNTQRQTGGFAK